MASLDELVTRACIEGNCATLKRLLDRGASPDATTERGGGDAVGEGNPGMRLQGYCKLSALHIAAGINHWDVVKMLLRHGVDTEAQAEFRTKHKLHVRTQSSPDVAIFFLGINTIFYKDGETALEIAKRNRCDATVTVMVEHKRRGQAEAEHGAGSSQGGDDSNMTHIIARLEALEEEVHACVGGWVSMKALEENVHVCVGACSVFAFLGDCAGAAFLGDCPGTLAGKWWVRS